MELPKGHTQFSKMSEALSVMIKFADENEDFVLAAKLEDARDTVIQRRDAATR
jgi:hypothetical protein